MKAQNEEKPEMTPTVTPTSVVTPDARIRGLQKIADKHIEMAVVSEQQLYYRKSPDNSSLRSPAIGGMVSPPEMYPFKA